MVHYDRPIGRLRDYLRALLDTGTADVHGATLTADLSSVPPALLCGGVTPRVPLLVAAMGPQALRAAGAADPDPRQQRRRERRGGRRARSEVRGQLSANDIDLADYPALTGGPARPEHG
jgi:hypothetical protein